MASLEHIILSHTLGAYEEYSVNTRDKPVMTQRGDDLASDWLQMPVIPDGRPIRIGVQRLDN